MTTLREELEGPHNTPEGIARMYKAIKQLLIRNGETNTNHQAISRGIMGHQEMIHIIEGQLQSGQKRIDHISRLCEDKIKQLEAGVPNDQIRLKSKFTKSGGVKNLTPLKAAQFLFDTHKSNLVRDTLGTLDQSSDHTQMLRMLLAHYPEIKV